MTSPPASRMPATGWALRFGRLLAAALLLGLTAGTGLADQTDPRLDGLFADLQSTSEARNGEHLAGRIRAIWMESGSAAVDLIMAEGVRAMAVGRYGPALDAFDTAIEIAPEFAEGWNKRATVRYLMGDYEGSRQDAEKTLDLEPRHFGAMSGLGLIHAALDEPEHALKWFRRALAINPHLEEIRDTVRALAEEVEGKPI